MLFWIVTIACCYAAVAAWLTMTADAIRRRRVVFALLLVGGGAAVVAGWNVLPEQLPLRILILALLLALLSGLYWLAVPAGDTSWRSRKRMKEEGSHAAAHLVLLTGTVIFTVPFVWMVMTSLKPEDQLFSHPASLPHPFLWSNYPKSLQFLQQVLPTGSKYGLIFLGNTMYVSVLTVLGVLVSSSLAAYAFARLRWPGRNLLFLLLLSTMMLPAAVTMVPVFMIYRSLGWVDTLRPLWFPSLFAAPFYVFLLRQFFMTIPRELEEAARIDGCGYFRTFWKIMVPQIKPALAAVAIMQFLATWNDFMGPLIYISSPEKMTGSYALQLFQSAHGGEWALLMAAATLWTIPIMVLFFFTQRYFIQGVTLTGIKG